MQQLAKKRECACEQKERKKRAENEIAKGREPGKGQPPGDQNRQRNEREKEVDNKKIGAGALHPAEYLHNIPRIGGFW